MLTRFVIYGFLGLNMEVLWTGLSSALRGDINLMGHTSVWMFFIYGSAVFLLEPVHGIIAGCNFFTRGCIWAVLIFTMEFACGMLLRLIGIEAWHYSGPFSIYGIIRLDYLPAWFAVGLIFERLHDVLIRVTLP